MRDLQFGYAIVGNFIEEADFVLLDKGEGKCCRYIAAHYPKLDRNGDLTSWGQGHYCNTLKEALEVILEWIKDEEDEDWFDADIEDGYSSNAPCDNSGYCVGTSCSRYFQCHS